jgi:hypothetical protein
MVNIKSPAVEDALKDYDRLRMVVNESVAYHVTERNVFEERNIGDTELRAIALQNAITYSNARYSPDIEISKVLEAAQAFYGFCKGE